MSGDSILTPEQREFLDQCERDFGNRYTENDADYVEDQKTVPPPIVYPWITQPERNNREWRGRRNDWRSRDSRNNWRERESRNDYRDRESYHNSGYEHHRARHHEYRHHPYNR